MNHYEVTVGNIGYVHEGHNLREASRVFSEYKEQSKIGYGRAAGEQVVLCKNGEPVREYFPPPVPQKKPNPYKPGYMQGRGAA